ncbi:hypothetical protein PUN28_020827 [Cardiocondyla obscurior]|uniref:Secreted protein n=1 Tax=Cardiocondyla obscurior TaxID=286306 RepID=A0AAW2E5F8_9HYME
MTLFNPFNVIILLYVTFSALNLPQSPINSNERKVKETIKRILLEMLISSRIKSARLGSCLAPKNYIW